MTNQKSQIFNWILLIFATLLLASLQTTFWYQITGGLPAPLLWLNLILYIILYRKIGEGIFINYALGVVLSVYTSMSLGALWTLILILSGTIGFIKSRIFWPGTRYFTLVSLGITIIYQVVTYTLSNLLETNPSDLNLYTRALETILTPISAVPIYWLLSLIDRFSEREPLPERGQTIK